MKDKINKESPNFVDENQSWLKEKFPSCFTEGKLDFKKLEELLKPITDTKDESYSFSWAGRANSIKNIQTPAKTTLIPQKDESIDFDNTENIFIEGENLEVLKLLQKSYSGKIKMIYIDPPYNTGNDFVYNDDFTNDIPSYLEQTGQAKDGVKLTNNPETSGRFHSDWISFMYPRLFLARELLRNDGVIFISIDDNEFHNLRNVMNEIFGEENFIANIVWQKKYSPQNDAKYFSDMHDFVVVYAKKKNARGVEDGWIRNFLPRTEEQNARYKNPDNDPRGVWKPADLSAKRVTPADVYPIITPSGREIYPPKGRSWITSPEQVEKWRKDNRIWFGKKGTNVPSIKIFLNEVQQGTVPVTWWDRKFAGDNQEAKQELKKILGEKGETFETPKPVKLIKRILQIATNEGDVILDFYAGSGTTSHAVFDKNKEDFGNRKFICVQLPERLDQNTEAYDARHHTIADITKERIRRAIKQIKEESKQQKLTTTNQDLGFKVFKLAKSNYKQWDSPEDTSKLKTQLKLFENPLIENYKDLDVIYEVIIKEGYSLNSKIEKLDIKSNTIYKISDQEYFFFVCLDKQVKQASVDSLKLYETTMFVCLDSALDDSQKSNLSKTCNLRTI